MVKGAGGSYEKVAETVFIEETMEIRAEDTGVGRNATVLMKRWLVAGLPGKLSKRLCLFQEECFPNVDLVPGELNVRNCLTKEQ